MSSGSVGVKQASFDFICTNNSKGTCFVVDPNTTIVDCILTSFTAFSTMSKKVRDVNSMVGCSNRSTCTMSSKVTSSGRYEAVADKNREAINGTQKSVELESTIIKTMSVGETLLFFISIAVLMQRFNSSPYFNDSPVSTYI